MGTDCCGIGALACLVGHWSFAVRNDVHYRSRIALWVTGKTALRWTLSRDWQLHQQCRYAAAR